MINFIIFTFIFTAGLSGLKEHREKNARKTPIIVHKQPEIIRPSKCISVIFESDKRIYKVCVP